MPNFNTDKNCPRPIFRMEEYREGEYEAQLVLAVGTLEYPSYYEGKPVTKISSESFVTEGADSVERIIFPEKLRIIGASALAEFSSLRELIIPEGVEEIYGSAFYGCRSLKKISIPRSAVSLDAIAFGDTPRLAEISVDKDNPEFCSIDGNLYTKDLSVLKVQLQAHRSTLEILVSQLLRDLE